MVDHALVEALEALGPVLVTFLIALDNAVAADGVDCRQRSVWMKGREDENNARAEK